MCSFGDFAAVSHVVDASLAGVLKSEVCDGIIAPGFDPEVIIVYYIYSLHPLSLISLYYNSLGTLLLFYSFFFSIIGIGDPEGEEEGRIHCASSE